MTLNSLTVTGASTHLLCKFNACRTELILLKTLNKHVDRGCDLLKLFIKFSN